MTVINTGKTFMALNEVKPVENINKNPQNYLEMIPCKRKSLK